jgi:sterigmatocystin biosynthesis cytochrome P450 monooxygenase
MAINGGSGPKTRTIIDLALSTYLESETSKRSLAQMDPFFKKVCMSQIKLFLFSGHDTTSSSICFHFYLLSQHAEALAKLRAEHESVFGPDPETAADLISSSPHLLNQLPYTTAVIRESLRLFPTVTISREGEPGFSIADEHGRHFPTENFLVWPNPHTPQHDPAYWPQVDEFLPERWLVGPEDPLYPVKGAWRAFEHGPRNCIGQELAMLEMKTVLVLVVRLLEVTPAYDELDKARGGKIPTVHGVRGYQVNLMQPAEDLPCRVKRIGRK